MEFFFSNIETLLLSVVIFLQIVLIFLVLNRELKPVLEEVGVRRENRPVKEKTAAPGESENLWENPPPASEELKATVEEFKSQYQRNEPWDGDFAA